MNRGNEYRSIVAILIVATMFSALASAVDVPNSAVTLSDPISIYTRPPLEIHEAYLCEEQDTPGEMPMYNYTDDQIDVLANYSFYFNVSDRDNITGPNSSHIMGVGFIGYVSFEGDPGTNPMCQTTYDKRNYEFFMFANRTGGGGNQSTSWEVFMIWSNGSAYDNEVRVFMSNSSVVYERDIYNETGADGTDGVLDTVSFRMQFRLGAQIRNTNATDNNSADCWYFYAAAYDNGGGCNTTKDWNHTFDVYQYTKINSFGKVAGGGFPGGGGFRLMTGDDRFHVVGYAANNNVTFYVNATDLITDTWSADTLKFNCQDESLASPNWTMVGPENTTITQARHALNATGSKLDPKDGESGDGRVWWSCTGIPSGVPTGVYTSTITYRIYIDGTTGPG